MKDWKREVLDFWFVRTSPVQWFQISGEFDSLVRDRFLSFYDAAKTGAYGFWETGPDGCLALCLTFDQFPRILFRGTPDAYASDALAVRVADVALSRGFDQLMPPIKRRFLYLPFEHSENLEDQKKSLRLFGSMREEDPLSYEYAQRQAEVIERFGRFPGRNRILGRESTPEEERFLSAAAY
jgi:uncharacterized protein (DUF924 family)